ncbi:MAG TPA: FtsK/SpoIIIE domain-containing protein [Verrucomicrobiae bacterium]
MSDRLSVSELGAIVNGLRTTAARIQEASTRLEKDAGARKSALVKQADADLQRLSEIQSAAREEIVREGRERVEHLEQRTAERKNRITKAFGMSRKRGLDRFDEVEGRRKFAVQKGLLDTERWRDQRIAELEREWADQQNDSHAFQHQLGELRRRARSSFRAYPTFWGLLKHAPQSASASARDKHELLREAETHLKKYRGRVLPELFRFLPIWLCWIFGITLLVVGPARIGLSASATDFRTIVGGVLGILTVLYFIGWSLGASLAKSIAKSIFEAESAADESHRSAEHHYTTETTNTRSEAEHKISTLQREWDLAIHEADTARDEVDDRTSHKMHRALSQNEQLYIRQRTAAEGKTKSELAAKDAADETAAAKTKATWQERISALESEYTSQRSALESEWDAATTPAREKLQHARQFAEANFSLWSDSTKYIPPTDALNAIRFGETEVKVPSPLAHKDSAARSFDERAPLLLTLPDQGSIIIETDDAGRGPAIDSINNIIYRALQTIPPGKASFTLIDPVRLGQSFSSIMHLADFEENIVNRRIWTEPAEIEERLLELNAHMEKVIQMYLRNEFRDIVEYNKEAGRIAEKYHFVVIADFPASFTETAMRRLLKIVSSGARCGVYTLVHFDKRHQFLPGFEAKDFLQNAAHLLSTRTNIAVPKFAGREVTVRLDPPPGPELATRFLQEVGEASRGSNTVQVPFAQIAPTAEQRWSLDTTEELRVPIGRSGATKLQYFSLGKGTRQHVLIAGKTGSGKSTLLHVLVSNLALWSSPEQVEFYLVDFKKGVEFKDYAVAKLPHARVVAIESDREFGLSVLRRVDEELRLRGELFRAVGAQDLAGYKRAARDPRMPRVLLIIDEFQELFVEDDSISQNAALLLDRIVRQGRAFGIHVVLGSQTLGGAYSLARSTLGQMALRIALQTNEADAYLIMDESNPAPRLLSRPGEGIYNDAGGALEANSPFQVVWLPENERREALRIVTELGATRGERNQPIVFEGNTLADIADNTELHAALETPTDKLPATPAANVWLGLPNEIKGPTRVLLDDRTGRNLLIAGQQEDHTRSLLAAGLVSLAAQNSPDQAAFLVMETPPAIGHLSIADVAARLPHEARIIKPGDVAEALRTLAEEIERRERKPNPRKIFLLIQNLPAFKALRPEDEFSISFDEGKSSPAADFTRIYTEGPVHGIHVIAHVDGFNNANRFLGRKGLKEFSARVLFQMSASDSASFADDPRASNLGLNRALFYDEHEGTYETFRPYSRPTAAWLSEAEEKLLRKFKASTAPTHTDVAHAKVSGQ